MSGLWFLIAVACMLFSSKTKTWNCMLLFAAMAAIGFTFGVFSAIDDAMEYRKIFGQ